MYKEPVMTCDPTNVFEPVVAYLPSMVVILPPKPLVVVATDELKSPIEELSPDVVVTTDPDNEPIELLKFDVVVATEPDRLPILLDTEELNVFVVVAMEPDKSPRLDEAEDVYELNEPV